MGSMLKSEKDLMTLQIKCDGPIKGLTVTAEPSGFVKGYAIEPSVMLPIREEDHKLDVSGAVGKGYLRALTGRTSWNTREALSYSFCPMRLKEP